MHATIPSCDRGKRSKIKAKIVKQDIEVSNIHTIHIYFVNHCCTTDALIRRDEIKRLYWSLLSCFSRLVSYDRECFGPSMLGNGPVNQ